MSDPALEEQKANCIFCKIIKGEVPGKTVYEDDKIIAILDINPAVKGHVLVLPKEHYPILPLIPFDEMQALFKKTHELAGALKEAMMCSSVTVFIANGAAAGQQSPHFIYHLIPREENDSLSQFTLPQAGSQEENESVVGGVKARLSGMMNAYLQQTKRAPIPPPVAPVIETPSADAPVATVNESRLDELINVINNNAELKEALINRPEEVKEAARTMPKWQELFSGVDIDKLSENLKAMALANVKNEQPPVADGKPDLDNIGNLF